jgi:hypothetical protein
MKVGSSLRSDIDGSINGAKTQLAPHVREVQALEFCGEGVVERILGYTAHSPP